MSGATALAAAARAARGTAAATAVGLALLAGAGCGSAAPAGGTRGAPPTEEAATAAEATAPGPTAGGDAAGTVEATSLLGAALRSPEPADGFRAEQEAHLAVARQRLEADAGDLDAWIWVGRRTAYLGRHREAIAVYTRALERFPTAPELYRHRGHRWLTVREVDRAAADLERGVELMAGRVDAVEADGLPNVRNVPTGTLGSNLWYHLGLARYLRGEWGPASEAFASARDAVDNPDNLVAASYWLYLAAQRQGNALTAATALTPIAPDLDVIENGDYHRLLLVYAGQADAAAVLAQAEAEGGVALATVGYGLAAGRLLAGQRTEAATLLGRVVAETPWAAFGHLAAEAELARDPELRRLAGR